MSELLTAGGSFHFARMCRHTRNAQKEGSIKGFDPNYSLMTADFSVQRVALREDDEVTDSLEDLSQRHLTRQI